jgi:outer membrane protein
VKHMFETHRVWEKIFYAFFIFGLFLALNQFGRAEEVKTLSLSEAIEIARHNNPDLKQVANQVRLNKIQVSQRKANFLPAISLTAQSAQKYAKAQDMDTGIYSNASDQSLALSGTLSLNLFNGFYDRFSLQQSKLELTSSRETLTRYQQTIIFETIQCYIQVVLSKELISVDRKNLDAQRIQLKLIEDFFKSGKRPVADLYQQQAEISRYEYLLLDSERNFRVNRILLFQILGINPDANYQISEPGIENLIKNVTSFNEEKDPTMALKNRTDYLAQKNQIEAAKKGILSARSGYWPTISLNTSAGTAYTSSNELVNFSDQILEKQPSASIGLSLSIPIFDKNVTRNNVALAKINLNNQQLELEKLSRLIMVELQQAIEDYRTAKKQVGVAEAQEKYARFALESVEERYHVNAATMAELIQARSQQHESQYNVVEAKFQLLIRGMAVAFYLGDGESMMSILTINN